MKPTDMLYIYPVDRNARRDLAIEALAQFFWEGDTEAPVMAMERGMLSNCDRAEDVYHAVRPHGYAVFGKDMGRIGGVFRTPSRLPCLPSHIARFANVCSDVCQDGENAPHLVGDSSPAQVIGWLQWNDRNGDFEGLTGPDAWMLLHSILSDGFLFNTTDESDKT